MKIKKAIVTGAAGLVGSEATTKLLQSGYTVHGIENDMRRYFFGDEASTHWKMVELGNEPRFKPETWDIRDAVVMERIVAEVEPEIIIHTAAQPSHDWAAREPFTDFGINALGTLNLLEATRKWVPDATFCHISTSKVYGDNPNSLPLEVHAGRYDLPEEHIYHNGIKEDMSVDNCLHSLFGVSKLSGDLLVQEYSRYFNIPAVCFRPGCISGPDHSGTELHGFLAYLMKCCVTGRPYTVYGYNGNQVRCNIYGADLADACLLFHESPKIGAVYNIGGGRKSACSMNEAIDMCEDISGCKLDYTYSDKARIGDHMWWISSIAKFQEDYPQWEPNFKVTETLERIYTQKRDWE